MQYLKIKNWKKYQHYKDRNPPWIKFYHSILDDYIYSCLQDDSKLLLITLLLLAGKTNNKIPYDIKWIQNKSMIKKKINLKELLSSGFVFIDDGDSNLIADEYQDATLRREEKIKRREEKKFVPPTVDDVIKYFQENGYSEKSGKNAFYYYEEGDWKDSRGQSVRNWKQKMRGVWFKPENKQNNDAGRVQPKEFKTPDYLKNITKDIG